MVNDAVPAGAAPRTACVDEPVDRGADYSTMGLVRASESSRGAAGLDELLPDPRASAHLRTPAHLEDAYYAWATRVDDVGLQQMLQLWESAETAPDPDVVVQRRHRRRPPCRRAPVGHRPGLVA